MSFSSYRFAIKGRLNLLPTRVTAKRAGKRLANTTCRKCKEQPDTLGHVLNGCTPNASLMRERHNSILQRLSKAIPPSLGTQFLEQNVKDFPHGDLRPDLVVWHSDKKVTIIDVAIPYEGDSDAFTKARNVKRSKYQPASDSASRMATPTCLVQMKVAISLSSCKWVWCVI